MRPPSGPSASTSRPTPTARARRSRGTWCRPPASRTCRTPASSSTRSRAKRSRRRSGTRAPSTSTSSTRSRRDASSTGSSATASARCCGARCAAASRPAACSRVALRIVVEREREVLNFTPMEYWSIEARLAKGGTVFGAMLQGPAGGKAKDFTIPDGDAAAELQRKLQASAYAVTSVRKRPQIRRPAAPFTTSTLQQEASRRLGFTPDTHDGRGAAALRRRGARAARRSGPHHLHANRLHERRRFGGDGDARVHRREVRRRLRAREATRVHEEGTRRAGGARGHPPDIDPARARLARPLPHARSAPALHAHLAAHARQPDGRRRLRHDLGRHRPPPPGPTRSCCARPTARCASPASAASTSRPRTTATPTTTVRRSPTSSRATRWRCATSCRSSTSQSRRRATPRRRS